MELAEIERLVATAAAACKASLPSWRDAEHLKDLYAALEPLATRAFDPFAQDLSDHMRGLVNQSSFLSDIVRGHIEDTWRTDSGKADRLKALKRSGEGLLKVLDEISQKAR